MPSRRATIEQGARDLARAVIEFCESQKELWNKLAKLTGQSTLELERNAYSYLFIDLRTGELKLCDDDYGCLSVPLERVLPLGLDMDEINAARYIARAKATNGPCEK